MMPSGVFITPLAPVIAYFVIPAVTKKPIYSHFYSMIGFWLLFLVYPLNGIHHYVYSSLPVSAQHASEVASIYQGIDVIIASTATVCSDEPPRSRRAVHGNNSPCAADACCTPRLPPSAGQRHGFSSAPSATPADAGTATCGGDPETPRASCGTPEELAPR